VRMDMAEEILTLSPLASCSRGGARVVGQGFRYMGRGERDYFIFVLVGRWS